MACICPHLISGASEVSLVPRPEDRTRLLGSTLRSFSGPAQLRHFYSVPEYWAGPRNEATLVSQDYLSSCMSSMPCFLFCPGLTQPVFFLLCCFNSMVRCHVRFYVSLSPLFAESFAGHFKYTIVPYRRPPKLNFKNFRINYPLVRNMGVRNTRLHVLVHFQIFHNATIVIQ